MTLCVVHMGKQWILSSCQNTLEKQDLPVKYDTDTGWLCDIMKVMTKLVREVVKNLNNQTEALTYSNQA